MYEAFFGLQERPFQLTPNPRYLFLNAQHREALATLRYGLVSSPGITLLLGEAGTGKTTLLRAALHAERRAEHRYVVLSNPTLSPADFYEILADRFGLPDASGSKGRFLLAFERDLLERYRAGGLTAVIVDEAQSLTHELFEEIRLLANLETATAKLVNVVLVGQPELADRLNDPSLRQLKQRIVLRCTMVPLDLESTASYIATRLQVAGASPSDGVHERRRRLHPRGLARNPEDHRGHLRERAARGVCRAAKARRSVRRGRGVPGPRPPRRRPAPPVKTPSVPEE